MGQLILQGTGVTDSDMRKPDPTGNYSNFATLEVGESNGGADLVSRTIVKFDLSSIPANAIINSAILTITPAADASDNARTLSVYRIKRAVVIAEVSWNNYSTGNAWGTAGCGDTTNDREATDIGTVTQPASPTLDTGIDITLTAAKIQEIVSGAFANNGFLLQVATETDDRINYHSTEAATAGYKPKLVVNYSLPSGGMMLFLG